MLGDLGLNKDFLCRDRALMGPVSRPWTVSRPGVIKAGRPCVATQQMCHNREVRRRSSVATDFSKFSIAT